jgi:nicotinamide mononucleotide transporter
MVRLAYGIATLASALLLVASLRGWISAHWTEAAGFVAGAWCVWLVVRENIWNWPLGLLTSAFYIVVFSGVQLYTDAGLQVVYIFFGLYGWYWWLHGGAARDRLSIARAPRGEFLAVCAAILVATVLLAWVRTGLEKGSFAQANALLAGLHWTVWADAFTTAVSLGAQYLLTRKYLENWMLWIFVDVLYIPLYLTKGIALTAVLYAVYLVLAILGLVEWRRRLTGPIRA